MCTNMSFPDTQTYQLIKQSCLAALQVDMVLVPIPVRYVEYRPRLHADAQTLIFGAFRMTCPFDEEEKKNGCKNFGKPLVSGKRV